MAKILTASLVLILSAAVTVVGFSANGREAAAGLLTPTPTVSPSPAPSPSPSPTAAATATATSTGSPSASASASPLPAAAPQTGGQPGSGGSDALVLTLLVSAAAVIGVGGVFAGKYALERRS